MDFALTVDYRVKLRGRKKKDKYLDLTREHKAMEHESDSNTNCNWVQSPKDWYRDWMAWK